MSVSSFQKLEKIGEGTYGIVYKAKDKKTGRLLALKKIRPESENEGIPATTIREIILLKNLKHSTIIDLMEVIHNEDRMYLVFEFIETDLKKLIDEYSRKNVDFDEYVAKKMSFQLCTAVSFCHSRNIFHRDLKPQNILVDSEFNIKLADFGLGRAASIPLRVYTSQIITLWYRPPELLLGQEYYDSSVDIWSLACIFIEIYTLVAPFMGDSEIDQIHKIFNILGTPSSDDWKGVENLPNFAKDPENNKRRDLKSIIDDPTLLSLVERMLLYNPMKRLTELEVLEDDYFLGFDPIID